MGTLRFFKSCLLHALAGCGMGVVLDSACDRLYKRLAKTSLHDHLARFVMILLQLALFVGIAAMEVVYTPSLNSAHEDEVASLFFELMLFGTQFSFFERIQTLTKDV